MILRVILLCIGLVSSYLGSLSFQNGSAMDMVVGGGALLIAILCFFFLAKGLWRFLGCLSTFLLMAVIVGVLFFFVSGSNIIKDMTAKILNKPNQTTEQQTQQTAPPSLPGAPTQQEQQGEPQQMQMTAPAQPQQAPMVVGKIDSIVSGDVFRIGRYTIRLFGVASPVIDQTCSDQSGHAYQCGYVSARMLKDFVGGDDVKCRIININAQKELMAACSVGTFDIGAAMVEEGWAIALPTITQIYVPYQMKAQQSKNGLWAGQFQMPWEWVVQQKQLEETKAKIKVPDVTPKKKKKSIFDAF